ncbi:DUF2976 domain-containing protein [Variovorax sp. ZS18.2.2]|uniref:DUF2976 domain-containing protein n=1 Tax=Variovorax sp. ZS18.2.2 TaxID=2971255 RepID=UPI0021507E7E|nr:DUF2976 domain-containing protein [Variovorax sp. ZS18.2.2]MCR6480985.1 DUF2976 domain-containing protein [Variovorax sp. ZS18.2.2]
MSHPAFAELPKIKAPSDGIGGIAVDDNNWLAQMGAWFKMGVTILGLILGALGFIYVVSGALQKWKQYAAGRAEIGDLKEYFIMGAILTVFLVVMIGYATQTLA